MSFVTKHSEYHLRDGVCIAVRDRASGHWVHNHPALHRPAQGTVRLQADGSLVRSSSTPAPGEALLLGDQGQDLLTSALCSIERPTKKIVMSYPPESADGGEWLTQL